VLRKSETAQKLEIYNKWGREVFYMYLDFMFSSLSLYTAAKNCMWFKIRSPNLVCILNLVRAEKVLLILKFPMS
jgi:hypothetical protein